MKNIFLFGLVILFLIGCNKEEDQAAIDKKKIVTYLDENGLDAVEHSSGLFYKIIESGTGYYVPPAADVTVRYTGKLLDGTVFDSGTLDNYPLYGLIPAWQIGIPLLKKGGKATLYSPSDLAYGSKGAGDAIPPNSVLIFVVEVIDFIQ